jgi:hypothetical protein
MGPLVDVCIARDLCMERLQITFTAKLAIVHELWGRHPAHMPTLQVFAYEKGDATVGYTYFWYNHLHP